MIHSMANRMASVFISYGESSEEDRDIYVYACEKLLSTIVNIGLGLLASTLLGKAIDGIIFMAGFAILRRYAGGYHARTRFICILAFTAVVACGMVVLSLMTALQAEYLMLIFASIGFVGIFLLAPVEHENKPLGADLQEKLKKKSRCLALILLGYCLMDFYILRLGIGFALSLSMFCVFGSMAYATAYKLNLKKKESGRYEKT